MNYPETLAWIHGTERFGSRLGLGRMGRLLHRMGDPHLKVPAAPFIWDYCKPIAGRHDAEPKI